MEDAKRRSRRKHSAELKARVLSECAQPGASVAAIAQVNGLNANLVHRWLRLARPVITAAGPVAPDNGGAAPLHTGCRVQRCGPLERWARDVGCRMN